MYSTDICVCRVLLAVILMQLAFSNAIYLVDAIEGGEALVKACKPALESSYITKVIHDCKRDSEVYCCLISPLSPSYGPKL